VSLSQSFFCALNDARELSCFRLNPSKASLKKLQTPRSLKGEVLDVSVGAEQICAVSAKSAVTCWTYTSRGVQVLYVPNRLRKPDSALRVHSAYDKHCAIGSDARLTCWGSTKEKKYKEQFEDTVRQVSMGQD